MKKITVLGILLVLLLSLTGCRSKDALSVGIPDQQVPFEMEDTSPESNDTVPTDEAPTANDQQTSEDSENEPTKDSSENMQQGTSNEKNQQTSKDSESKPTNTEPTKDSSENMQQDTQQPNETQQQNTQPSTESTPESQGRTEIDTEQSALHQQLIGTWTGVGDFGRDANVENERQLRKIERGEYDGVGNYEELSERYNNYKKLQEDVYLVSYTIQFTKEGVAIQVFNKQEYKDSYLKSYIETMQHYSESLGRPYTPLTEEHKKFILDEIDDEFNYAATTNQGVRYKIVDQVLFVQSREWGKMEFKDNQLILTPTDPLPSSKPIILTRVS